MWQRCADVVQETKLFRVCAVRAATLRVDIGKAPEYFAGSGVNENLVGRVSVWRARCKNEVLAWFGAIGGAEKRRNSAGSQLVVEEIEAVDRAMVRKICSEYSN